LYLSGISFGVGGWGGYRVSQQNKLWENSRRTRELVWSSIQEMLSSFV
jgi:hypothetical protein